MFYILSSVGFKSTLLCFRRHIDDYCLLTLNNLKNELSRRLMRMHFFVRQKLLSEKFSDLRFVFLFLFCFCFFCAMLLTGRHAIPVVKRAFFTLHFLSNVCGSILSNVCGLILSKVCGSILSNAYESILSNAYGSILSNVCELILKCLLFTGFELPSQ